MSPSTPAVVNARRTARRGAVLLLLGVVLSLLLPSLDSDPASAAPAAATASITWRISTNAWSTSGSLVQGHVVEAPATESPAHVYNGPGGPNGHATDGGFTFPGGGTYDPATGTTSLHFGGAVTIGNTSFGNLRIRLANLALTVSGGDGTLSGDVGWCIGASDCADGLQTTAGITIVTLPGMALSDAAGSVTATTTPACPDRTGAGDPAGTKQFPASFLAALDPQLHPFFQAANPGQNATKCPAPLDLALTYAVPTTSSTAPSTSSTVAPTSSSTTSSTTSSTVAPDPAQEVEGGTLDWGVKQSFRDYITGNVAKGSATPGDGTTINGDGTYRFPWAAGGRYRGPASFSAVFQGSVHFSGHDGALELELANPRVSVSGDEGTLFVSAMSESGFRDPDVAFADLDLSDVTPTETAGGVLFEDVPVTLREEGAEAFAGFYEAGEALDPVTVILDLPGEDPVPTTSTTAAGGTTSSTAGGGSGQVGIDQTSVAAGGRLTASGAGFLPGEQVQVYLHSTPRFIQVVTADAQGRASTTFTVPSDLAAGSHRVELRGVTSGRSILSSPFTVTTATGGGLPRTGSRALELSRWGLLLVGLGLLARGRAQLAKVR